MITLAAALAFSTTATADDKMKKEAPKKWEAPKPDASIAEMAKGMAGNWKCTGKAVMDASGTWVEFKGTNKMTLDGGLDKFWIKGEYASEATNKAKMKGVEYITFDATQKKWYRLMVTSDGGHEVAWSDGFKDGKSSWNGDMRMMGMTMKTKADVSFDGKELKVTAQGEMNKKWVPNFEMSCKK
jgi:hypothetical protein